MEAITQKIEDVYYLAALCATKGLGRTNILTAAEELCSAKALFEAEEAQLLSLNCFRREQISNFLSNRSRALPGKLRGFCQQSGVELLSIYSEAYPASLKEISDPPLVLYVLGKIPRYTYGVAVVGSRECSGYGERVAREFTHYLASSGITIISGGAKGIDTIAHETCLAAGGNTIAVLGCGIDIAYPSQNKMLFQRIAKQGAVISEYPPGTPPLNYNFPARNRIVVGLSQAVLVAEARRKSGALITAHLAADEGRDVYAIPGDIFKGKSLGCHDLIRKGATPVDTPEEILENVRQWKQLMKGVGLPQSIFDYEVSDEELKTAERRRLAKLSASTQAIYEHIGNKEMGFDELIEITNEDFMTISQALLELQSAGLIEDAGMQRYRRI